jgi:hypothetical protein
MYKRSIKVLLLVIVLLTVLPIPTFGQESQETNLEWQTYSDPRFDFTIEYPATWIVEPRTDAPGTIGETLAFHSPPLYKDRTYSIAVGQYLDPIREKESLSPAIFPTN